MPSRSMVLLCTVSRLCLQISRIFHMPIPTPQRAARKSGKIICCVIGNFDNLNPFILKSLRITVRGMIDVIYGNSVFEPLTQRSYDEAFSVYGLLVETVDMDH